MAIYHFSVQVLSRSAGRSAVAAAAYRAGERLHDERYGRTHDYTKKDVSERGIAAPEHAPAWVKNREQLWNAVEQAEKRKDAQLCREVNVALPRELNPKQQRDLLSRFITDEFVKRGMIADVAIHRDNPENPHAHIMLTMREITPDGFGNKVREWNDRELLENWREQWARYANRALERAQVRERIDHRSFAEQGKEIQPTIHLGHKAHAMEKRGVQTERGDVNRSVSEYNRVITSLESYRVQKHSLLQKNAQRPLSEPQRGMSAKEAFEKVREQRYDLLHQRNEVYRQRQEVERQLRRIAELQRLREERDRNLVRLQELQPKTLWQKLTNPNKDEIERLERSNALIDKTLREQMPPAKEIRALQEQHAHLDGVFKAIQKVFERVDKEFEQQRVERVREQVLERQKAPQKPRSREWDRER